MKLRKQLTEDKKLPITPPSGVADYIALIWATGLLSGYAPVAPGTFGSAVAVIGYYGAAKLGWFSPFSTASVLPLMLVCVVVSYTGIWASNRAEHFFGYKDPNEVVVDEVAGQLITYLFLSLTPNLAKVTWSFEAWTLVGFFVFRGLDILKPYPVRDLERLESGLGIMGDDILAGIQGAVLMAIAGFVVSMMIA